MLLSALVFLLLAANAALAQNPALSGLVNSGDYTPDIAPGAIVSVFGQNLATQVMVASRTPLPTSLDGTSVEVVAGGRTVPLPLFFVSPGQINAQMPYDVSGSAQVRVRTSRGTSGAASMEILPCAPKLFTWSKDGKGEAVVLHADYSPVNSGSPAQAGETVILYLTGLGAVSPQVAAGTPAGDGSAAAPINYTVQDPLVLVGGQPARVVFAGLAPYFAGLYQLNVQIPVAAPSGLNSLVVYAAQKRGQESATVAVRSSWVAEKTASIGPAGGAVGTGSLTLSLPAGAVSALHEITLYRQSNPEPSPGDKYRVSDVFAVSGMPEAAGAPVTVALQLARQGPSGGRTFVVLRTQSGAGDGGVFLEAKIEGDKAIVTLPAYTAPKAAGRAAAAPRADVKSTWSIWVVAGYYALTSAADHFRIVYPLEDLIEGGAEQVAEALETAYTRIANLGLPWTRRNGVGSWPIDVSIEYFEKDRRDRWGEEGSTILGVQRQGINLNAHFISKRENIELMRITAGHELFHIMQNLYDVESAPSTWLWFEEASSVWLERRIAKDASYIPTTVAPVSGGTNNYDFFARHGLEFPPGDAETVQNHGYGASLLLESISRRHGDAAIGRLVQEMAARAPGISARPAVTPVQAIQRVTGDVGVEWQQFCESYMALKAYGERPAFPARDTILSGATAYRWTSPSDTGPIWTFEYPDLSARVFYVDLRSTLPANTRMRVSLTGGGAQAAAIVYRTSPSGEWTRLALVRDGTFEIANAEAMIAAQQRLAIMVVNSRASSPFTARTPLTLRVETGVSLLDWLSRTRGFFFTARTQACFADLNGVERCAREDFKIANRQAGLKSSATAPLAWSGTKFSLKGRVKVMDDLGGNFDLDVTGEVDATGKAIKNARFLMKSYLDDGSLYQDWDVEIFDYPLDLVTGFQAVCTNCAASYEPRNVADWSQKLKIHKMSQWGTLDGVTRERRRFTRLQSVISSWAFFEHP